MRKLVPLALGQKSTYFYAVTVSFQCNQSVTQFRYRDSGTPWIKSILMNALRFYQFDH